VRRKKAHALLRKQRGDFCHNIRNDVGADERVFVSNTDFGIIFICKRIKYSSDIIVFYEIS